MTNKFSFLAISGSQYTLPVVVNVFIVVVVVVVEVVFVEVKRIKTQLLKIHT